MRILIVDDEPRFARILAQALAADGYEDVGLAGSAEATLEEIRTRPCEVLVTDLRLPGLSGLELMAEVKRRRPATEVILMTAFADVETVREALKRGALDYLVKPFDNAELAALIAQARARRAARGVRTGQEEMLFAGMVGGSAPMRAVFSALQRAARAEAAVLIATTSMRCLLALPRGGVARAFSEIIFSC